MKTFYILKILPALLLPLAPAVVQAELQRHGVAIGNNAFCLIIVLQILLTFGIVARLVRSLHRKNDKAFLRMSCVSKKVCVQGQWMSVEKYLADHHNIVVSHGMTPEESDEWLRDARAWADREFSADSVGELEPALK